jgi:hypothetical protein
VGSLVDGAGRVDSAVLTTDGVHESAAGLLSPGL